MKTWVFPDTARMLNVPAVGLTNVPVVARLIALGSNATGLLAASDTSLLGLVTSSHEYGLVGSKLAIGPGVSAAAGGGNCVVRTMVNLSAGVAVKRIRVAALTVSQPGLAPGVPGAAGKVADGPGSVISKAKVPPM